MRYYLRKGETITLIVSDHESDYDGGSYQIGSYIGTNINNIDQVDNNQHFDIDNIVEEYNDEYSKNIIYKVTEIDDNGNEIEVSKGSYKQSVTKLTLYVSKGKEKVTVPDMQYMAKDEAIALLEKAGYNHVISEYPEKDTEVDKGTKITINVSLGPESDNNTITAQEAEIYTEAPVESYNESYYELQNEYVGYGNEESYEDESSVYENVQPTEVVVDETYQWIESPKEESQVDYNNNDMPTVAPVTEVEKFDTFSLQYENEEIYGYRVNGDLIKRVENIAPDGFSSKDVYSYAWNNAENYVGNFDFSNGSLTLYFQINLETGDITCIGCE